MGTPITMETPRYRWVQCHHSEHVQTLPSSTTDWFLYCCFMCVYIYMYTHMCVYAVDRKRERQRETERERERERKRERERDCMWPCMYIYIYDIHTNRLNTWSKQVHVLISSIKLPLRKTTSSWDVTRPTRVPVFFFFKSTEDDHELPLLWDLYDVVNIYQHRHHLDGWEGEAMAVWWWVIYILPSGKLT